MEKIKFSFNFSIDKEDMEKIIAILFEDAQENEEESFIAYIKDTIHSNLQYDTGLDVSNITHTITKA